jgi:hypothetical protein
MALSIDVLVVNLALVGSKCFGEMNEVVDRRRIVFSLKEG